MRGEIVHYTLNDVGAELDLDKIQTLFGVDVHRAALVARSPLPRYAGFEQPVEAVVPASNWGEAPFDSSVEVRVHAIGVVTVRIRVPIAVADLASLAGKAAPVRIGGRNMDELAEHIAGEVRRLIDPARVDPYNIFVEPEPYLAFVFSDPHVSASPVLEANRALIAALLEAEADPATLAPATVERALRYTIQYQSNDAVVLGWDRALIVAPDETYEDVLDVIELANLERLELRTYDAYLDRRLDAAFGTLGRLWAQGGLFKSARKTLQDISEMRIEFSRLTDNLYDTHKLFGDWYVATIHQALTMRFHLDDWRGVVAGKMDTLEGLFESAQEEVNHRRALVLEAMIVLLFILDLVLIFTIEF